MGRVITTTTDLSEYEVGDTIRIAGSDCCWTVLGPSEPDLTVREVRVIGEGCYYSGVVGLSFSEPEIVTL